jgi:hypothetical protein
MFAKARASALPQLPFRPVIKDSRRPLRRTSPTTNQKLSLTATTSATRKVAAPKLEWSEGVQEWISESDYSC